MIPPLLNYFVLPGDIYPDVEMSAAERAALQGVLEAALLAQEVQARGKFVRGWDKWLMATGRKDGKPTRQRRCGMVRSTIGHRVVIVKRNTVRGRVLTVSNISFTIQIVSLQPGNRSSLVILVTIGHEALVVLPAPRLRQS